MQKLRWTWKKIVGLICGLLGIGTLTSCYGMVAMYGMPENDYFEINGIITGDVNGDGNIGEKEGIPNLKVTINEKWYDFTDGISDPMDVLYPITSGRTDENGKFSLFWEYNNRYGYVITVVDDDGSENGEFKNYRTDDDKLIEFIDRNQDDENPDLYRKQVAIKMERKDK